MSNPLGTITEPTSALGKLIAKFGLQYVVHEDWRFKEGETLPLQKIWKAPKFALEMLRGCDMEFYNAVAIPAQYTRDKQLLDKAARGGELLAFSDMGGLDIGRRVAELVLIAQRAADLLPVGREDLLPEARPLDVGESALQQDVYAAAKTATVAKGGVHFALGRLREYYPKKGDRIARPISADEARRALARSKVIPDDLGRARVVVRAGPDDEAGGKEVRSNPSAENGFPVGLTLADQEAREMCVMLAGKVRSHLQGAADVVAAFRQLEKDQPYLTLCKGKAKYDCYKLDKIKKGQLRFYNVVPRQMVMLMQQATQVLEEAYEPGPYSFQGRSLAGGRAQQFICDLAPKPGQVMHSTTGDDCVIAAWFPYTVRERDWQLQQPGGLPADRRHPAMYMGQPEFREFAGRMVVVNLDCSAFDLTQHGSMTEQAHAAVYERLKPIDHVSAGVWYAMMRERSVTVSGSVVARFRHAGPSGMPLQSLVNDIIMQVFIERLYAELGCTRTSDPLTGIDEYTLPSHQVPFRIYNPGVIEPQFVQLDVWKEAWTQEEVDVACAKVAADMGLRVRVEGFLRVPALRERANDLYGMGLVHGRQAYDNYALFDVLTRHSFTYIGYNFYAYQDARRYRGEHWGEEYDGCEYDYAVRVEADLPRAIKQFPYKTQARWLDEKGDVVVAAALKAVGVLVALGQPQIRHEPFYDEFLLSTRRLVTRARKLNRELTDQMLGPDGLQRELEKFVYVGASAMDAQLGGLERLLTREALRRIWESPAAKVDLPGGLELKILPRGRFAGGPSQVVERVGPVAAGRPPKKTARMVVREIGRAIIAAGGISKLPKHQQRAYFAAMRDQEEDERGWSEESESYEAEYGYDEPEIGGFDDESEDGPAGEFEEHMGGKKSARWGAPQ